MASNFGKFVDRNPDLKTAGQTGLPSHSVHDCLFFPEQPATADYVKKVRSMGNTVVGEPRRNPNINIDIKQTFGQKSELAVDSVSTLLSVDAKSAFQLAIEETHVQHYIQPSSKEAVSKGALKGFGKPTIYDSSAKECIRPPTSTEDLKRSALSETHPNYNFSEPGEQRVRGYNEGFRAAESFGKGRPTDDIKVENCLIWETTDPLHIQRPRCTLTQEQKELTFGKKSKPDDFNASMLLISCAENDITGAYDDDGMVETKIKTPPKGFGISNTFDISASDLLMPNAFTLRGLRPEEAYTERAIRALMECTGWDKKTLLKHFRTELNLDPAALKLLVKALEVEFGIAIPDASVAKCDSLFSIVQWVIDHRSYTTRK